MPELPEVETVRRGLKSALKGQRISKVQVRQPQLRWPIPKHLSDQVGGQKILTIRRRGKYLLVDTRPGSLLIHLGMSGSLRLVEAGTTPMVHEHYDLELASGLIVRYRDPRRFGALLWAGRRAEIHPLLSSIGPEPFSSGFSSEYLYRISRNRHCSIKSLLMNSQVVAGIGNIYASEILFHCRISPARSARHISKVRYAALVESTKEVLGDAIRCGGTTLKDYTDAKGSQGYFRTHLNVYGKAGNPCPRCQSILVRKVLAQRSSYYCPACQR